MHVLVLGAGVTGVTTAWYLAKAGFQVSVVDRQPGAALETSHANGGQISISHPEPWANPGAPRTALRWLGREDAPLLFRPHADPAQWRWALAFLRECLPQRTRRNTAAVASLAVHSGERLRALRAETGITYDQLERGILHLFFTPAEFDHARTKLPMLEAHGIRARACGSDECVAIEPALAGVRDELAGGLYAPDDESGDACRFTQALAELAAQAGVHFHYNTTITNISRTRGIVDSIGVRDAAGRSGALTAGAYVMCLGSYGSALVAPLGERLPIYPVKGYSVTVPVLDRALAPSVSLTDESRRIVCSRLGERLRIAGTAELNGFNTAIHPARCQAILDWLNARFPGATDIAQAQLWTGLRPATPGNVPLIGRSGLPNLWYNTGHGTLGWTLACGSASSLADLMSGHRPPVRGFPFLHCDD
ncbi:D-amino acid dehydrogenase [Aromatoleum diolicum]|uniref:D-amino acid dehydrogenase n=1 Tax=Aromatoleum diolicum TaxID=75796 RepID=A0ABX1Q6U4_9RHOO|nr:D-amino acid dehydrogenase [Aromatoleum diolicum]NMG73250.1 FAD-dependent oxidoreductase [Aromatoleum diolicum]